MIFSRRERGEAQRDTKKKDRKLNSSLRLCAEQFRSVRVGCGCAALCSFAAIKMIRDHEDSDLQISPPKNARLGRKTEGSPKKITLFFALFHFFVTFSVVTRCPPAISAGLNSPKKSCLKTSRRFFVFSGS
jgi:hypothetical protein